MEDDLGGMSALQIMKMKEAEARRKEQEEQELLEKLQPKKQNAEN